MSPGRVLATMVMGLAGGLISELLDMALRLTHDPAPNQPAPPVDWRFFLLGALLGLCIGVGLAVTDGLYSGSRVKFRRHLLYGALAGPVCGYVAFGLGGMLYSMLGGDPTANATNTVGAFLQQMVARTGSWTLMGLFLGTVGGLPTLSTQRMRNGAVGGLLGGSLGGFVFQSLASMHVMQPFQIRLLSFAITGAAIGFFVGLVGEVLKRAWVKVLIGRNEGREHILDQPVSVVGRDELADIPIFVDRYLAPRQASIRFENGRYLLYDEAGRQDTRLRGQVVTAPQPLTDGDVFQVGKASVAFFEKATAAPGMRRDVAPPPPVRIPAPGGGVCEFCGVARDPATGACACSVAGAAPGGYVPPGAYAPQGGYAPPGGEATVAAPAGGYDNPFAAYMDQPAGYGPQGGYGDSPTVIGQPGMGYGPRLVALSGPYAGQAFPLGAPVVSIGREAGRDITVNDTLASRRHASVYAEPAGYVLRDEGSSNGTFVNGTRVGEHVLYPGDEIRIGGSIFRFEA